MTVNLRRTSLIHRTLCQLLMLAVVAGATIALAVVTAGPARADACSDTTGVTVVVDFGGGNVDVRCTGAGGTGLDVLHRAGFSTVGTASDPVAFVCGINGVPTDAQCPRTPPSAVSWWYSRAPDAQSGWSSSTLGATSTNPGNGSFEGWAIGANNKPSIAPPALRPPPPDPATAAPPQPQAADPAPADPATPAAPAPTASAAAPTRAGGTAAAGPSTGTVGEATSSAPDLPGSSDSPAAPTESAGAAPGDGTADPSGSGAVTAAESSVAHTQLAATSKDSGSPLPTIIAVLAVVAIGIGAGVVGLRRRGRSASP